MTNKNACRHFLVKCKSFRSRDLPFWMHLGRTTLRNTVNPPLHFTIKGLYPFPFSIRWSNFLKILNWCTRIHMDAASEWLVNFSSEFSTTKGRISSSREHCHSYLQAFEETLKTKHKLFCFTIRTICVLIVALVLRKFYIDEIWTPSAYLFYSKRENFLDSTPNGLTNINNAKSKRCLSSHPQ